MTGTLATFDFREFTAENPPEPSLIVQVHGLHHGKAAYLKYVTFAWVMNKAASEGLDIDDQVRSRYAVPLDAKLALDSIHESWTPIWGIPRWRSIAKNGGLITRSEIADLPQVFVFPQIVVDAVDALLQRFRFCGLNFEFVIDCRHRALLSGELILQLSEFSPDFRLSGKGRRNLDALQFG